jgi:hypothetical protein
MPCLRPFLSLSYPHRAAGGKAGHAPGGEAGIAVRGVAGITVRGVAGITGLPRAALWRGAGLRGGAHGDQQ